ncbi:MAG: ABC transporter ATP-binding protein [Dehalococcoidia bacterium]
MAQILAPEAALRMQAVWRLGHTVVVPIPPAATHRRVQADGVDDTILIERDGSRHARVAAVRRPLHLLDGPLPGRGLSAWRNDEVGRHARCACCVTPPAEGAAIGPAVGLIRTAEGVRPRGGDREPHPHRRAGKCSASSAPMGIPGKTTAMKMLLGLVRPTASRPPAQPPGRRPDGAGAHRFPAGAVPLPRLDAAPMKMLDFHGRLAGMSRAERGGASRALALVGLAARAGDRLRSFSKGMQQRAGLAQAILNDPELVFLDEPTSALDPVGRREVRDIIRRLRDRGATVFLNSHLLSEVEQVCDRLVILDHGRVVRAGPLRDLLRRELDLEIEAEPLTPSLIEALAALCGAVERSGDLLRVTVPNRERIPAVAAAVAGQGARLYRLAAVTRSLEDLFVETVEESGDR